MATIRKLSRDPVAHVRLQVVERVGLLRNLDPAWAWSEIKFVLANEPTRGVVAGAIASLALAYLDLPRTIHLAKEVIRRYAGKIEPGMPHCRSLAATLICDVHIHTDNAESAEFASALLEEILNNSGLVKHLVARYSDNLLTGSFSSPEVADNEPRRRTVAFYRNTVERAFAEIERRAPALDARKFNALSASEQESVRTMFGVLDEVSIRLFFASGGHGDGSAPSSDISAQSARLYREAQDLFARLACTVVAPIAHHLIQALEAFIPLDPSGVFAMIAQSVRSAEQGGYGLESMAADLIVRIVERYLADYRSVFADQARLNDLMDCLDVFVRAGWPAAQSLTFRLGEIWR